MLFGAHGAGGAILIALAVLATTLIEIPLILAVWQDPWTVQARIEERPVIPYSHALLGLAFTALASLRFHTRKLNGVVTTIAQRLVPCPLGEFA